MFLIRSHDKKIKVKESLLLVTLWKYMDITLLCYLLTGRFTYFGTDGIYEVRFVDMKRRYAQQKPVK